MKKKHQTALGNMIKESLNAHKMANWNDSTVRETIAKLLVKKFAMYMKQQKELKKLGLTEQDCMIPPNALGVSLKEKE